MPQNTSAADCREEEYGPGVERISVLRSTDRGATWTRLGDICTHSASLIPADPSPIAVPGGIALYILDLNGLDFTLEPGVRLASSGSYKVANPHPTMLAAGGYAMSYAHVGTTADQDEIHLATSPDAFTWTGNTKRLLLGGMPGIVETSDGTLLIYYVDFDRNMGRKRRSAAH